VVRSLFSRPTVSLDTQQSSGFMSHGGVDVREEEAVRISAGRPKADRRRSGARTGSVLVAAEDGRRPASPSRRWTHCHASWA
jgi:hypothetical protein